MTKLRLRSKVNFPANVTADGGIAVRKESGKWVVYPKFSDLVSIPAGSVADPATQQVWIYNPSDDSYAVLTLAGLGDALFKLTSTTSNSIGLGSKTFTVQSNKDVGVGQYVVITDDADPASNGMYGKITNYTGSSLTVSVEGIIGSGTKTAWTIRVSGITGATGATGYATTSLSSVTIGTGMLSFTVASGLAWQLGARARASYSADKSKWVEGIVASYSGTTLQIDVDLTNSSGTFADWKINVAGERGAAGASGAGSGDVVGPSGAGNWERAAFNTTTGKLIRAGNVVDQIDRIAAVPTLDLDGEGLAGLFTLLRSSAARYWDIDGILKTAAANVPRLDYDPVTRQLRGLLIESSATNHCLRSQEFDNAYWSMLNGLAFGAGSVANATTAPDGTVTADKFVEDTATGQHSIQSTNIVVDKNVQQVFSCFVKAAGQTAVRLMINSYTGNSISADFDLSAGTVTGQANNGTGSGASGKIEAVGNDWFRCSVEGVPNTTASTGVQVSVSTLSGGALSYLGDGTSGVYFWGAQHEHGVACGYASSYIPTTSATVTRARDQATLAVDSTWFNAVEGTLFVEWTPVGVHTGPTTDRIGLETNASEGFSFRTGTIIAGTDVYVIDGGVPQVDTGSVAAIAGTKMRGAFAYKANDIGAAINGTDLGTDASCTIPTATMLSLGDGTGGAYWHSRVIYWTKRHTNAQMQLLTAA